MLARALMWAYVVVGAVEVASTALEANALVLATKPLLMPLLIAWVVADARCRPFPWPVPLRWLVIGLAFAWAGDVLLLGDGDLWFAAGIGAFAVTQVSYLVAFWRVPGPGLVRAWRVTVVPYVVIWLLINVLVWPGAGALRVPVVIYSALLILMALSALDLVLRVPRRLGWRIARGAGLFVMSDALIALTAFGPLSSAAGWSAVIMATYIAGQGMIAAGFTRAMRNG